MLTSLRIENFKAIRDSGAVPLPAFLALIGRNGSGKSSLIEAIDWLGRALLEGAEAASEPFQQFDYVLGGDPSNPERRFKLTLEYDPRDVSIGEQAIYTLEVGAEPSTRLPCILAESLVLTVRDQTERLLYTEGATRFRRTVPPVTEYDKRGKLITVPAKYEPYNAPDRLALGQLLGAEPLGDSLYAYLTAIVVLRLSPRAIGTFSQGRMKASPRLLDEQGHRLAHLLTQLNSEQIEELTDKLQFILSGATDLHAHEPLGPSDRRFFTLTESQPGGIKVAVPAWMLSEGTRRMTAILALVLHDTPPPLLCIEEIENGLDPWTLSYLLEELTRLALVSEVQIIITTHSPYLLDMLSTESVILCQRDGGNVSFIVTDQLPDRITLLQNTLGLGTLYRNRFLYDEGEMSTPSQE